jgi:HEAT repeat protein
VPRLLANQRLALKRFWIPLGGTESDSSPPTLRLQDGILPDPDDEFGRFSNPSLKALADIQEKRCFALLGQPGLGKTIVTDQWIEDLRSNSRLEDEIISLTGRGLAAPDEIRHDTIESSAWKRARSVGGDITLILDGLDEALQRLPVLLTTLRKCFKDEPMERTRVVLVSRVADWRDSRAEELFALWPEAHRGGAFELCPLRWCDVRFAAKKSRVNPDTFQKAVLSRRVGWMAGRPKLLLMLLEEFAKFRRLPDSRSELFRRAAIRMCEEHDSERHEVLVRSQRVVIPTQDLFPVVARISALLLLTGKTYVFHDSDLIAKASDLLVPEVVGGLESAGDTSVDVDAAHVLAALDTAHFVACGPGRMGFDHQAMGEFMAAQYLGHCTADQLRSLLAQRIDGQDYLSPQFREISAWIAINHPEFRNYVLKREPRVLLEADAIELNKTTRLDAVSSVLAQIAKGEESDAYISASILRSLKHPSLVRQIRPYINDDTQNVVVRRTAIRMAEAAGCSELKGDLWQLVATPQISVRRSAIRALAAMGSAEDKQHFMHALRGIVGASYDEELKGEALRFLVPKYLSVPAVLKFLTPRDENLIGAYYAALHHHLPDSVRVQDVIPILKAYRSLKTRQARTGPTYPIVVAAVTLGLQRFNDLPLRRACIQFFADELQMNAWETTWEGIRPKTLSKSANVRWRRAFLEGFVARSKGRFVSFLRFNLWPQPDDFVWTLKKLQTAKGTQTGVWVELITRLVREGIPHKCYSEFLRTYDSVHLLRGKLPKPRRFGLKETLRRYAQASERWRELWQRRAGRRKVVKKGKKLTISEVFEHFPRGEPKWWVIFIRVVNRLRSESHEPATEGQRTYSLTTWPIWQTFSQPQRRLVRAMARRFLLSVQMPKRRPGFSYQWDDAALYAMVLTLSDIGRSHKLQAAIKKEWVPALFDGSHGDEPELRPLIGLAYTLDSGSALGWFKRELRRLETLSTSFHSLLRFQGCWDKRLTALVAGVASASRQGSPPILYAFALLLQVAPAQAVVLWRTLQNRSNHGFDRRARLIAFLGLMVFPSEGWQDSLSRIRRSHRSKQIRLFAEHVQFLSYDFSGWPERLSDEQLGELYELIVSLFPPSSLKDYARGRSVGARDHIGDLQRACLNLLVQRGTASACSELRRLSESVAEDDRLWMKWRLREAIDQRLRTEWALDQPKASVVLRMARTSHSMRVRDCEELQEAIICSLTRLQTVMRVGEFPKLPGFWQDAGLTPKLERDITRGVAEWLNEDLRGDSGVVVDREPQVGYRGNIDIKVEIPPNRIARQGRLLVVIEIKRCMHEDVQIACETQLAEGYLRRKAIRHGIYLVAWFDVSESRIRWSSVGDARSAVNTWALSASDSAASIRGFLLDCRWEEMDSPSALAKVARQSRG